MSMALRKTMLGIFSLLWIANPVSAQVTIPVAGSFTLPLGGALTLGCSDLGIQGNFSVGAGQIAQAANLSIAVSGLLDGGQGTINVGTSWSNAGTFIPGTSTVIFGDGCGAAPFLLTGSTTFNNLTLTSASGRTFVIPAGHNITVNGTLTLQGVPGLPIQLVSSSGQTAYIALGAGAQVVSSNATVLPNVQIGNANAIPTLSQYGLAVLVLLLAASMAHHSNQLPFSRRRARLVSQGESRNAKP